jgi:hypothetical protein
MTREVIAGYYGFQDWEGMSYAPLPQVILEEAGEYPSGLEILDITGEGNDPGTGERVWRITGLTQEGLDALEENNLVEVL